MKNQIILLVFVLVSSCKQKEIKVITVEKTDSVVAIKEKETAKKTDDTIYLNFMDQKEQFTVEGELDSIHTRQYIKFQNDDLGILKAKINPTTGKGNIRFNQIVFPDNTSDGPFGTDLNLNLTQKGNHILVIGHSQMADYPFYGKFKVQLQINGD
jgi:hypothetical protein